MIESKDLIAKLSRLAGLVPLWVMLGALGLGGCAHVAGNYPQASQPKNWVSRLHGPQDEFRGLVFKVNAESSTLASRETMASLAKKMTAGMGAAPFSKMMKDAEKGHELGAYMRKDEKHVFYRGSLTLSDRADVVIHRGALVLTIQTEQGVVSTRDRGIIFPRHSDRNLFEDSGRGPVTFGLAYNGLSPGDENRIQVRSEVFGKVLEVAVDSTRIEFVPPR